jgi:hypothetical protein
MTNGKLSRRSFLNRVTGGVMTLGALGVVTGQAQARQQYGVTDADRGANADPAGRGRGTAGGGAARGVTDADYGTGADPFGQGRGGTGSTQATGVTDADGGPGADPVGGGRGHSQAPGRNHTGLTDSDSGSTADRAGYGMRGGGTTGVTDQDYGTSADPIGNGRGSGSASNPAGQITGITDSDGGQYADRVGQGRGNNTGITDADQGTTADAAGRGRGTAPAGRQVYTGRTDHDVVDQRGYGTTLNVRDADYGDLVRPPGSPSRNPRSYYSDQDPTDYSGRGVRGRQTGVSDNDTFDSVQAGRGSPGGRPTKYTDHDAGPGADAANYGRCRYGGANCDRR